MKKFFGKKRSVALAAVAVLVVAAAAIAYFTNANGTATGNGSVGVSSAWNVAADPAVGGNIYPGVGTDTFTGTVTNTNAGHQLLHQVSATIVAPTGTGSIAGDPACTAGDFHLDTSSGWVVASDGQSATYAIDQDLPGTGSTGGAGSASWTALTLSMNDPNTNQDNCQGATPHIQFDAS